MIRFFKRATVERPRLVAVMPGTWNPPTVAHLAIAAEALRHADETLLLLPERLPHKAMERAPFGQRIEMLLRAAEAEDRWSVASVPEGLFLQVAEWSRQAYKDAGLALVCGRDAAERILHWPYEDPGSLTRLFALSELWVFARGGHHEPPPAWRRRIRTFDFDAELQEYSASEVRRRVQAGEEWRTLVPEGIHALVETAYREGETG